MKCAQCGQNEANTTCNCLIVRRTVSDYLNQRTTREQAADIHNMGLCDACVKKLAWKQRGMGSGKLVLYGTLSLLLGFVFFVIGNFGTAETGPRTVPNVIGAVLVCAPGLSYFIYDFFIGPKKLRAAPEKLFGHVGVKDYLDITQPGNYDILVPLMDYKDEREFKHVNEYLSDDLRKQIYPQINNLTSAPVSGEDLLMDSVRTLLGLYRNQPQGFLKSNAGEVRSVGQRLNDAGGMDLMLQAHAMFASQNPGMARNLEIVWDGIGSWMG